MLNPILKKRAVYLKGIRDKSERQMRIEPKGSINYQLAYESFICSKAALSELIIIEHELSKLSFFHQ